MKAHIIADRYKQGFERKLSSRVRFAKSNKLENTPETRNIAGRVKDAQLLRNRKTPANTIDAAFEQFRASLMNACHIQKAHVCFEWEIWRQTQTQHQRNSSCNAAPWAHTNRELRTKHDDFGCPWVPNNVKASQTKHESYTEEPADKSMRIARLQYQGYYFPPAVASPGMREEYIKAGHAGHWSGSIPNFVRSMCESDQIGRCKEFFLLQCEMQRNATHDFMIRLQMSQLIYFPGNGI